MSVLSYYAPLPHIASFPPLWHKSKPVPKNKQTKTKLFQNQGYSSAPGNILLTLLVKHVNKARQQEGKRFILVLQHCASSKICSYCSELTANNDYQIYKKEPDIQKKGKKKKKSKDTNLQKFKDTSFQRFKMVKIILKLCFSLMFCLIRFPPKFSLLSLMPLTSPTSTLHDPPASIVC